MYGSKCTDKKSKFAVFTLPPVYYTMSACLSVSVCLSASVSEKNCGAIHDGILKLKKMVLQRRAA